MSTEKEQSSKRSRDEQPQSRERIIAEVAEKSTAVGLAALTAGSGGALAAAAIAGAPAVAGFLGRVCERWQRRKQRELAKWWDELVGGDRDFEAELEAALEDESGIVPDIVIQSVRELLDATAPEAVMPLARLAREYLRNRKAPDRLFRGAAEVLSNANAAVLDDLRTIGDLVSTEELKRRSEFVTIATRRPCDLPTGTGVERAALGDDRRYVGQMLMRKVGEDGQEVGVFTFVAMARGPASPRSICATQTGKHSLRVAERHGPCRWSQRAVHRRGRATLAAVAAR